MITVYYERYYNDYRKFDEVKTFRDLGSVEEWLFGMMKQTYKRNMCFPTEESAKRIGARAPWNIQIFPSYSEPSYNIHMMRNDYGIIFSDGRMTNDQRHWNDEVAKWCEHCEERTKTPIFDFV